MTVKKVTFFGISFLIIFALGGLRGQPLKKKPVVELPVITSLRINNGEPETRNRDVELNFNTSSGWWQWRYRVSYVGYNGAFGDWQRRPYSWPVHARLADTKLPQQLCVQVQTSSGELSREACAAITYVFDVQTEMNAADIYNNSGGNSHTKRVRCDFGSVSSLLVESPSLVIRVGYDQGSMPGLGIHNPVGTKCWWVIFENLKLKPGWQFVRANYAFVRIGGVERKAGSSFQQQPTAGGRDLTFRIEVWAESSITARFQLNSLTVKGPSNQEVWRNGLIQIFE